MRFTIIRILLSVSVLIYSAFGFAQTGSLLGIDLKESDLGIEQQD